MKSILISITLLISASATAQFQPPKFDGIEKIIQVKDSPFYYPKIFERYKNLDTTLTVQDYRVLYFGYIFHKDYDPYGMPTQFDSLNLILQKPTITTNDYLDIIRIEKDILNEYPFNIRELSLLSKAYKETGQPELSEIVHSQFEKLTKAILSTGDGKTKETAMYVISNSHEYDILNFLGLTYDNNVSEIENTYEYLKVKPNKYKLEGIYFNIQKMFEKESEFLDKQK